MMFSILAGWSSFFCKRLTYIKWDYTLPDDNNQKTVDNYDRTVLSIELLGWYSTGESTNVLGLLFPFGTDAGFGKFLVLLVAKCRKFHKFTKAKIIKCFNVND